MSGITATDVQPLNRRARRERGAAPESTTVPRPHGPKTRRAGSLCDRFGRALIAFVFVAAGILCFVFERELRCIETEIQAWIMISTGSAETAVSTVNNGIPAVTFHANGTWISLRLIPQCAIAVYLGAGCLLSAILIRAPRVRHVRLFTAFAVTSSGLVLLNQVRLLVNGVMFAAGGREAFNWAYGPIGSTMMMLGVAGSLAVFFALCTRRAKRASRPPIASAELTEARAEQNAITARAESRQ